MADINKWTFHSLQTTVCSADQWSTDFDCSSADHTYSGSLIRPWIRKKLVPMKPKYFIEKKDICPSHVRSVPDKLVHKTCWKLTSICISLLWFLHFVFFNFFSILSISFFSISFLISDNQFRFIRIHQTLKHQFSWPSVTAVYRGFELHKPELCTQNRFSDLNWCPKFILNEKNFLHK